tara:strand:+ start:46 stop:246 length:201 start_codon:yes stop_codon:yes gene_type:complete
MRAQLIKALLSHAQGDLQKHLANIEIYLANPAGIGDHSDVVGALEHEINEAAKYQDQISVIERYIK